MKQFFRLSLRDLMWLTLVIGLLLGNWAEHERHYYLLRASHEAVALWQLRAEAVRQQFDHRHDGNGPSWPFMWGWEIEWENRYIAKNGVSIKRVSADPNVHRAR